MYFTHNERKKLVLLVIDLELMHIVQNTLKCTNFAIFA